MIKKNNTFINFLSLLIPFLIYFIFAEIVLRLLNFKPTGDYTLQGVGGIYASDLVTGWKNATGSHLIVNNDLKNYMTINEDASRFCPLTLADSKPNTTIFIGDSFTQGGGLNDEEIYPCVFQKQNLNNKIINFGTGGYGGCQSLLRLKNFFENKNSESIKVVIYGLNPLHEYRNMADPYYAWLLAKYSLSRTAFMPYCDLNSENTLEFHEPEIVAEMPYIVRHSSVLTAFESIYYLIKSIPRRKRSFEVTKKILLAMKFEAQTHNSRLIILLMHFDNPTKAQYIEFLKSNNIEYLDGSHPQQFEESMKIADGHPNHIMHSYWAKLISDYLQ